MSESLGPGMMSGIGEPKGLPNDEPPNDEPAAEAPNEDAVSGAPELPKGTSGLPNGTPE